ncbi:uncharacterized protein LOC105216540 isoform X2 [Zeugodacus cucurbitae]|uniref:uncharacterized protein LOC105216540 isoform X2 n=1 Tax=Zeugodacus cucurbitae TaxID=28588 RepID=UPI0023D9443C|nr:uncharacterized protein LOC105216540 isoform X2 [Zeugodacus cucurbitae]
MQNLFAVIVVFLVLNCLSVQIAEPLATSYAADVSQQHDASMEFNENEENLVQQQQHHVRHKSAHMHRTAAHHSRHRQQQHADGVKSESVAMASEITTPAAADAMESLNFQHKHKQQQQQQQHKVSYDMQLELDKQKKLQQQLQQKHTHAQHKNALKSRTSITTVMDNGSETVELAGVDELVKPTWPPTYSNNNYNNNERTITVDEANKGNTQNDYQQQAIIRQQQQQHQQQHHHKHHKLQPAADLSRRKATTMTSVVHLMHHNKVVHASSQINVDTDNADDDDEDDDAASSTVLHAHTHSTVGGGGGGIKEHKAAVSTTTDDGLTTENTRNDKSVDYVDDDDVEYYDYTADDEPNESPHATQSQLQPLAVSDIGGYTYDSGIDDGIDGGDVEWRPVQHHQQLRHNQEQWHAQQMQLHRRQHWQREEHQQQQQYESEHARVARDHHRVQASELRNNRLPFDMMDDYLNDEPALKPEEINDIKQKTLGTPDTVRNEFNSYVQNQRMRYLAAAHYDHMKSATRCERPMPHVIPASNYTSKTYYPTHTILYRCGEDTGCCRSKGQICTVKEYENVTLYFYVDLLNSSNSRQHIEGLTMRNHTKCACQNRPSESSTPEYVARGKRSDLAYRRHTRSHHVALDAENQLEESSDLAYGSEKRQAAICRCPIHFDVFQEDIRAVATQRHHHDVQAQSNVARTYNCRCDCEDDNASCQRFKNGDEGFGMDDRRCIAQRICSIPNCSFGIYNEQIGRCPRSNRKHKRHNIGFG